MRTIALVAALMLLVVVVNSNTCHRNSWTNGCSIPGNLPFFYKRTFTPSCHRHDVCYFCGRMFKLSRKKCDIVFRWNMMRACRRKNWFSRGFCRKFARIYYRAVRWFGSNNYKSTSPYWCRHNWVQQCIPRR